MVSRGFRLQLVLLVLIVMFSIPIGGIDQIPGKGIHPNITIHGQVLTNDSEELELGLVAAAPTTDSGIITMNLEKAGQFAIPVLRGPDYLLVLYQYTEQGYGTYTPNDSVTHDGIPDVYVFHTLSTRERPLTSNWEQEPTPRYLNSTTLPTATRVRIRVHERGQPDTPISNATVSIYSLTGPRSGLGITDVSVNDRGFAEFSATGSTYIELAGEVGIEASPTSNAYQERDGIKRVEINESRRIVNISLRPAEGAGTNSIDARVVSRPHTSTQPVEDQDGPR